MAAPETQVWYLHEWFAVAGKKQHDLVKGLDWLPAKANKIWHGIQPPKVHEAAEIAIFLNIKPHELLMPPEDAMRIRRLEAAVAEVPRSDPPTPSGSAAAPAVASAKARAAG